MNARTIYSDRPILIDLADAVLSVDAALRDNDGEGRGMSSLARVVGEIRRLNAVAPADLEVGDFIQRRSPLSPFRLVVAPILLPASNSYRLVGISRRLGEETMYRAADACLVVVRGVPLTDRLQLVVAARAASLRRRGVALSPEDIA